MSKYPLTNIHPDAKIADNVVIEPFTSVYADVEIGEGTWIGPNVTIMDGARIGKNCQIFPGAVVSGIPQDLKYRGEKTVAIIGDNTVIRECVTISRGTAEKFKTVVGANCLLMAYVHIAHDCIVGDYNIFSNSVQMAGHVETGHHVTIGGTAALQQFAKVGDYAFVTAGVLVRKDIPPYVKAGRSPLSYCGINVVKLKRENFSTQAITQIQDIYRTLYLRGFNRKQALEEIKSHIALLPEGQNIVDFVTSSKKGIISGLRSSDSGEDE
jgi:UDP-N-acetylglucosamine acyltransferase